MFITASRNLPIRQRQITAILEGVAEKYPCDLVAVQRHDLPRIAFHIWSAINVAPPKALDQLSICDIGGGIGLFSVGCAAIGFGQVILVDDFRDATNLQVGDGVLELHRSYGVDVVSRDIIATGMDGLPGELDVVTSFDSMEHWHHSPKRVFREVFARLTPGGAFLLGVPNNVNLRKRLTVPLGYGQWSAMQDWYEQEKFRGHVREPNVADLKYIAQDMRLQQVEIFGRNWLGLSSPRNLMRWGSRIADIPLRAFPSLCSDIYMSGKKAVEG